MALNLNVFYRLIKNKISIYKNGPVPGDDIASVFKRIVEAIASGGGGGGSVDAENGLSVDPDSGKVVLGGSNVTKPTIIPMEGNSAYLVKGSRDGAGFLNISNLPFASAIIGTANENGLQKSSITFADGNGNLYIRLKDFNEKGLEEEGDYSAKKTDFSYATVIMLPGFDEFPDNPPTPAYNVDAGGFENHQFVVIPSEGFPNPSEYEYRIGQTDFSSGTPVITWDEPKDVGSSFTVTEPDWPTPKETIQVRVKGTEDNDPSNWSLSVLF